MDKGRARGGDIRMAQRRLHQVRYSPHPLPFILPSRLCCRVVAMRPRTPALTILLPILLSLICPQQRHLNLTTDDCLWPPRLVDPYTTLIRTLGLIRTKIKTHHGTLRTNLLMHAIVILNTMITIAIHVAITWIHLRTTTTPTLHHTKLPTDVRQRHQTIVSGQHHFQLDVRLTTTRGGLGAVVAVDISP